MVKRFWVLAFVLLMVCCFASSSWAATFKIGDADFKLGGSLRYDLGYQLSDFGDVAVGLEDSQTNYFSSTTDSRVNLWAKYGDVTGFAEWDLTGGLDQRHAYLTYDMGGGNSLLAGHTWSLLALHFPTQQMRDDISLIGFGKLYSGRHPQLRFTHKGSNVTINVALEDNDISTPTGLLGTYVANELTPAILASLTFKPVDNVSITPSLLYQKYELTGSGYGVKDVDVDGWAIALDGTIKTEIVIFDFEAWAAQNAGIFADAFDLRPAARKSVTFGAPVADITGNDIEDVSSMGGWAQVAVPINAKTLARVGAGYQKADVENFGPTYESDVSTMGVFANVKYNLTKNLFVQPEVAYFDYGDAALKTLPGLATGNNDLGSDTYIGIHFQFDF